MISSFVEKTFSLLKIAGNLIVLLSVVFFHSCLPDTGLGNEMKFDKPRLRIRKGVVEILRLIP